MITSNVQDLNNVLNDQNIKLYTFDFRANYSNDLSSIYYNDFKSEIENRSLWFSGRNSIDYLVIFENEALKDAPYYKKSHLAKMNKQALFELYCEYFYGTDQKVNKKYLIEYLLEITNEMYYTRCYEEKSWHDLECSFVVCGYCQGDAIKVLLVGNVESYINESHLTNLFFDSPIEGNIDIYLNGKLHDEISFYDLENFNQYDYYDKDKLINMINEHTITEEYSHLLIDYLKENLPTSLSYDY